MLLCINQRKNEKLYKKKKKRRQIIYEQFYFTDE